MTIEAQMSTRQTDVRMDEQGRVYIPANIRKQLSINDGPADLRLTIEVIEDE